MVRPRGEKVVPPPTHICTFNTETLRGRERKRERERERGGPGVSNDLHAAASISGPLEKSKYARRSVPAQSVCPVLVFRCHSAPPLLELSVSASWPSSASQNACAAHEDFSVWCEEMTGEDTVGRTPDASWLPPHRELPRVARQLLLGR